MTQRPLLVYDGVCNLCIAAAKVLSLLDRHECIRFTPYQAIPLARIPRALNQSRFQGQLHLILNNRVVSGAPALSEVCELLIPLAFVCRIFRIPEFQKLYTWVAKRRYRIFGCRESCYVISRPHTRNH